MTKPATHPSLREKGPIGFRTLGAEGPVVSHITRAATDWAWGIAIGLTAVATGIIALLEADATLRALTLLIGASQAAQGILSILGAWRTAAGRKSRARRLITGTLLIAAGAVSLASASTQGLVIASGLWFAIIAVQDFTDAIQTGTARTWKIALGIVSLLGAALVLTHPDITLAAIARHIGVILICRGALQVGHSWSQHASPQPSIS